METGAALEVAGTIRVVEGLTVTKDEESDEAEERIPPKRVVEDEPKLMTVSVTVRVSIAVVGGAKVVTVFVIVDVLVLPPANSVFVADRVCVVPITAILCVTVLATV